MPLRNLRTVTIEADGRRLPSICAGRSSATPLRRKTIGGWHGAAKHDCRAAAAADAPTKSPNARGSLGLHAAVERHLDAVAGTQRYQRLGHDGMAGDHAEAEFLRDGCRHDRRFEQRESLAD